MTGKHQRSKGNNKLAEEIEYKMNHFRDNVEILKIDFVESGEVHPYEKSS